MPGHLGCVPVGTKVDAFEGKVGGYQCFVPRRDAEDRAVVADPSSYSRARTGKCAKARNQGFFSERHGEDTIAETGAESQNGADRMSDPGGNQRVTNQKYISGTRPW